MQATLEVMQKLLFCNENGHLLDSIVRFLCNYDVYNLTSLYLALVLTLSRFYYVVPVLLVTALLLVK